MSPRFLHPWMPAVAVALLSGSVLACPPGAKKNGSSAQFDVNPDNVKSDNIKPQTSKFRSMVLDQFDANNNGRLDSKERVAAHRALEAKGGSEAVQALRKQALVEFDTNHNGKLEKTEIHKALSSVNAGLKTAQVATDGSSKRQTRADRAAAKELQQQMFYNGITTTPGQIQTLENLLTNNSGTLTPAELALIQSLLTQLMAQTASTGTLTPLTSTTGTGTTGTNSSSTGTGMCSGGASGSSGSSGTGSSGTSTASSARIAGNQNANGELLSAGGGGGGGAGFGGGGGGFRGR